MQVFRLLKFYVPVCKRINKHIKH